MILGFCVENPPKWGERPPWGGLGEWGLHFWGSLGVDFGVLCGNPPPKWGWGTPMLRIWGGSPFLGVSGGGFWGSVRRTPPEQEDRPPCGGPGLSVATFGGLWGVFMRRTPPEIEGGTPMCGVRRWGPHFWGSLGGFTRRAAPSPHRSARRRCRLSARTRAWREGVARRQCVVTSARREGAGPGGVPG